LPDVRLTTKTRYGARAMLHLALHYDQGPVSSKVIAADQQLSVKYLERLLSQLLGAGLVRSVRGAQGGYMLARPPERINLREIFCVLEGDDGLVECVAHPELCSRYDTCVTQEVWARMYDACTDVLQSTRLSDLVDCHRAKAAACAGGPEGTAG
jgi:Rrf2 family cysteine metabolism transcriptional repressor